MRRPSLITVALVTLITAAAAQETPPETPAPAAPAPVAPPPAWLPRGGAELVALDKVSAQTTDLSLAVGQAQQFGSLTIVLRACDARPPEVPADATAWLDISDSKPGAPGFHGWLVASAPAVSGLEHPSYDVRLVGCR